MPCLAPSEVLTAQAASQIGRIAERFIADDYLVFRKSPSFFPAATKHFSDIHSGFANITLYPAFIIGNHPRLTPEKILALRAQGLMNVPDLMTDDAGLHEYYEIKPASPDGHAAGLAKMAALDAFYAFLGLPYVPGVTYNPNSHFEILRGMVLGCNVRIRLHFWLHKPGLLLYELCIDGQLQELAAKIGMAAALASIIVMLLMSPGALVPV